MSREAVKSLDEHREYIHAMNETAYRFTFRRQLACPELSRLEILQQQAMWVYLFRLDKFDYQQTGWFKEVATLCGRQWADEEKFVCAMLTVTKEFAESYAVNCYPATLQPPEGYNAGSLKYDSPLAELPRNHCNFHISNAISPKSILNETACLINCFNTLLDKSENEYFYDTLRTFTWLNSNPRWLFFFPDEWLNNLSKPNLDIHGDGGFWGQLTSARGTLNKSAAEHILTFGRFKYPPRSSHCSFAAMRGHLRALEKTFGSK